MNQQSLELILDLYKDEKIDKEDAVNIIEDLANNIQWYRPNTNTPVVVKPLTYSTDKYK